MSAKKTRLKVHYISPSALVSAYTTSVGKGAVVVPSLRKVSRGDHFVFEMRAIGLPTPIEVEAEVMHVQEHPAGEGYLVGIRYLPGKQTEEAIVATVGRLFQLQKFERKRKHARVPVNLPAQVLPSSDGAKVLDLSMGGLRLCFPTLARMPEGFKRGARVIVALSTTTPYLEAEVVWTLEPPGGVGIAPPLAGLRFVRVPEGVPEQLERMVRLVDFQPGPEPIILRVLR